MASRQDSLPFVTARLEDLGSRGYAAKGWDARDRSSYYETEPFPDSEAEIGLVDWLLDKNGLPAVIIASDRETPILSRLRDAGLDVRVEPWTARRVSLCAATGEISAYSVGLQGFRWSGGTDADSLLELREWLDGLPGGIKELRAVTGDS